MRKFFRLCRCSETIWRYVDDYELHSYNYMPLLKGEKLESKPDRVELKVTDSGKWPALLNNPLSWLIVTGKLKRIFEKFAHDHCCFFSLKGCFTGAAVDEDYWLLSFFRKINCMNRKLSDFREMSGLVAGINKLVIDTSLISLNEHVFLLDVPGTYLIVDQVFIDSLIQSNIAGFALAPIETSE